MSKEKPRWPELFAEAEIDAGMRAGLASYKETCLDSLRVPSTKRLRSKRGRWEPTGRADETEVDPIGWTGLSHN